MKRNVRALLTGTAVTLAIAACSSSNSKSGNSGQCSDFRGTYSGQLACSDGANRTNDVEVTQSGCTLTVTNADGSSLWTGSGNKATQTLNEGGVAQTCEVTLNGSQYTQSCTVMAGGQTVTCSGSGVRTGVPDAGGTGVGGGVGVGGSFGVGVGGGIGAGGSLGVGGTTGAGGSMPPAQCGIVWSTDSTCNTCMTTNCCAEMMACAPGTPCDALVTCLATKCPNANDAACAQSMCGSQLQTGSAPLLSLGDCNDTSCNACN